MNKNFVFAVLDYIRKNIVDVLLITSTLFIILILVVKHSISIKDNQEGLTVKNAVKKVEYGSGEVNIETSDIEADDESNQFCKVNEGQTHILEEKCNALHNSSCKASSCCVLAKFSGGKTKCMAGTKLGPTYMSDEKLNMHEIDNYYYQNKCYGKC
jgi:hypothetical protein